MEFMHVTVLLREAVDGLNIRPDGVYVDGTAGGGGHSAEILSRLGNGSLYSIDQDPDAIAAVTERFRDDPRSHIVEGNFGDMKQLLNDRGVLHVNGVLLDIGVSSHQLDDGSRGFSYHEDAPLDMRMSQRGMSAADLVNTLEVGELSRIISLYGEEKYAYSIAKGIVRSRAEKPIKTTLELAEIVKENVPQKVRRDGHPARKTFQAIRIAVNRELDVLESGLQGAFELLDKGGRLSVITFHSLEDRIVKQFMRDKAQGCTCPKDFPVCVCGKKPQVKIITRKPILPSAEELESNPRARSAKLRICEKL
ncbi:16S rRNA (cytosine(1402)-N(4))-methyltransferase RsmH [uncultured Ruminococcus sp.]|uniref:16S rRNA (cytosine(1402)-N(4))-methyltransferase RsmH n=1 Tax=uncultured Ruminococcus sp. TaxID=165186 RepID=UPI00292F6FC4|nr:16S rRNA (cytosine(1402)-N(4))-methyltransferase RsmH [uncultured Ruminococcus sp.]